MIKLTKNLITVLSLIFFSLLCHAQNKKSNEIGVLYKECQSNQSLKNLRDFFYTFPDSFNSFQKLYGFDDKKGASPYYDFASDHVALFSKTSTCIDKAIFSKKLFDISRNGKWDADAVSYFQAGLRLFFLNNSKQILELLEKKEKDEIIGFWYFFSDGPHFNKELNNKVTLLLSKNSSMLTYYLIAVKRVKKDNVH